MKYVGSKCKIAKYIVPIIQKYIDENNIESYIEPFVGGANVIDKIKCKLRTGFDIDPLVLDLHICCRANPSLLDELPEFVDKMYYYEVRGDKYKYKRWYRSAILLFASYNARVYGGCYGGYAITKNGTIRNYYKEALNNYKKQLPNLKGINFELRDYKDINRKNCVIYCDPPYAEGIGYKEKFNHEEFWDWCREMSKNNIVLISEYQAPQDFECIWQQEITTHMNNRGKHKKVEKLFMYKHGRK